MIKTKIKEKEAGMAHFLKKDLGLHLEQIQLNTFVPPN